MIDQHLQNTRENSIMFLRSTMNAEQQLYAQRYQSCPSTLSAIWVGAEMAKLVKDQLSAMARHSRQVSAQDGTNG